MGGLTLDTGALVALERERKRIREVIFAAYATGAPRTVPAPVLLEWWRGRTNRRDLILGMVTVEPLDAKLARLAGEALASLHRRGSRVDAKLSIDAAVMASAARSGSVVYTQDYDDLVRFTTFFPDVKVLTV
jgi:predicted nucleic acid-binding protein